MGFPQGKLTIAASVLGLALTVGAAQAQDKTFTMKITTPTLNAALDLYAKALAANIEKDTGGRIKVEVYPASQLGSIPRQIEGTQFGAIQCAIVPPEFFVGVDAQQVIDRVLQVFERDGVARADAALRAAGKPPLPTSGRVGTTATG